MNEQIIVPTLRKLSRKSVINFGQYEGWTVQRILDINAYSYLRWIYYTFEGLSFLPDILKQIHIFDEFIIEKPGKNELLHSELEKYLHICHKLKSPLGAFIKKNRYESKAKAKFIHKHKVDQRQFSKGVMQWKNQGH